MPGKKIASLTLCALLTMAAGCRKSSTGASSSSSASQPQKQYTTIDWATAGTITGAIHFSGKAPKRIPIDMGQDPVCSLSPANLTEQYVVDKGGLENVFVAIQSGLGDKAYTPSQRPVVMDQKGCRFVPHVVGVMVGQPVEFTNSDATMHNVHMIPTVSANQSVDISEAPNGPGESRRFSAPELMIPVRCNNHPWMEGFINVAANPFFAVSADGGHFTIKGVPPGTYTIVADHEALGTKTATVTVTAGKTATVDLTYTMPDAK